MKNALNAELRKLLTIRSTYLLTGFVLLLVGFLSFYVFGYQEAATKASSPAFLADTIYTMIGLFATFATVVSILAVAHEYRYNTIMHTLTSARRRLHILAAKTIVLLAYTTVVGILVAAVAYAGSQLGLQLKGVTLAPQTLPAEHIWQLGAYIWGYALVGIVLALIIRGLVGSFVAFFLIPTLEQMLSLLLKDDTKYLPFRSLEAVGATFSPPEFGQALSNGTALLVFSGYMIVFGGIATLLFLKRDAN